MARKKPEQLEFEFTVAEYTLREYNAAIGAWIWSPVRYDDMRRFFHMKKIDSVFINHRNGRIVKYTRTTKNRSGVTRKQIRKPDDPYAALFAPY